MDTIFANQTCPGLSYVRPLTLDMHLQVCAKVIVFKRKKNQTFLTTSPIKCDVLHLLPNLIHLERLLIYLPCFLVFLRQTYGIWDIYPDNTSTPNFARPWQAKWSLRPAGGLNPLLCCHCHAVLVPQWAKIFYMKFVLAGD